LTSESLDDNDYDATRSHVDDDWSSWRLVVMMTGRHGVSTGRRQTTTSTNGDLGTALIETIVVVRRRREMKTDAEGDTLDHTMKEDFRD